MLTLGIYAEIVQRWFGPITHVFAHQKTINPVRQGYEIRIPDMVVVLCQFENGMEGVMEFSGVALFETSDRLQVFGNQGMLSYDFGSDRITGGRLGEKDAAEIDISPDIEQRWRVEEDFIAAVRSPAASNRNLVLRSESSTCESFKPSRTQSHKEAKCRLPASPVFGSS